MKGVKENDVNSQQIALKYVEKPFKPAVWLHTSANPMPQ